MDGWVGGYVDRWMGMWVSGLMYGWMFEWMDGWMDAWKECMDRMLDPMENKEENDRRRKWWIWIREGRGSSRKSSRTFELKLLAMLYGVAEDDVGRWKHVMPAEERS